MSDDCNYQCLTKFRLKEIRNLTLREGKDSEDF